MKNITASNVVGLKELRENMEDYVAEVKKGRTFLVLRKSRPVFKISSPDEDDGQWERVVDFTKIKKGGVSLEEVLARL